MSDDEFTIDGQPIKVCVPVNALDLPDEVIPPEFKQAIRDASADRIPLGHWTVKGCRDTRRAGPDGDDV